MHLHVHLRPKPGSLYISSVLIPLYPFQQPDIYRRVLYLLVKLWPREVLASCLGGGTRVFLLLELLLELRELLHCYLFFLVHDLDHALNFFDLVEKLARIYLQSWMEGGWVTEITHIMHQHPLNTIPKCYRTRVARPAGPS